MWLLVFLFLVLTMVVAWALFGYMLFLWLIGLFRRHPAPQLLVSWPKLSVVVPCYNEEEQILAKLENLRKLDYPHDRLEVVFADGGSTDTTVEKLAAAIRPQEPYRIVRCPQPGKINQLNHVIPELHGDLIVNTDVDSRLAPDALKWLAAEFETHPSVRVVGAYCRPEEGLEIEKYYWDAQNKGRFLETDARSSSIVIAQCYALRRGFLTCFPEDVVADDVYVSLLANSKRYLSVYSRYSWAIETRGPKSYSEFLPHKFRKSNALLREFLRFVYSLPEMGPFCKVMLITRIAQQLLLPWALVFWLLLTGVLLTLFRYDVVIFGAVFLVLLLVLTNRVFASVRLPDARRRYSVFTVAKGYVWTILIMLATGISYPFYRQCSNYARLGQSKANLGKRGISV